MVPGEGEQGFYQHLGMQEAALPVAVQQGIHNGFRAAESAERLQRIDAAVQAVAGRKSNKNALYFIHRHLTQNTVLRQKITEKCRLSVFTPAVFGGEVQDGRLDLMQIRLYCGVLPRQCFQRAVVCEQIAYTGKPAVEGGKVARLYGLPCPDVLQLVAYRA